MTSHHRPRVRKSGNPVLLRLQRKIAAGTKPVFHQIMEAETRAKAPSEYRGGNLEQRGLLKRVLNSNLNEEARERLMRENHDSEAFRQVRTRKAKSRVRALRYQALPRLAKLYVNKSREPEDMEQLSQHRSRVVRILNRKDNPSDIFDAMIPLFEHQLKRLVSRKIVSEQIQHHIKQKTKLPKSMRKRDQVFSKLIYEYKKNSQAIREVKREIAWLGRMASRVEKGMDVSSAASLFIQKIMSDPIGFNVTE